VVGVVRIVRFEERGGRSKGSDLEGGLGRRIGDGSLARGERARSRMFERKVMKRPISLTGLFVLLLLILKGKKEEGEFEILTYRVSSLTLDGDEHNTLLSIFLRLIRFRVDEHVRAADDGQDGQAAVDQRETDGVLATSDEAYSE
jgi:hypothetical protein